MVGVMSYKKAFGNNIMHSTPQYKLVLLHYDRENLGDQVTDWLKKCAIYSHHNQASCYCLQQEGCVFGSIS